MAPVHFQRKWVAIAGGFGQDGVVEFSEGAKMKVFPYLSGFWVQARRSAALAALAAAGLAGTAEKASAQLYVNGEAVVPSSSSGDGWQCDAGTLQFTGSGPFLVTGNAADCFLRVSADCTVVASNLVAERASGHPGMLVSNGVALNLQLEGTNVLHAGTNCAGLDVSSGASVSISGNGTLEATGGDYAAGIGAGNDVLGGRFHLRSGTVSVSGGTVVATGGACAAGIGGGYFGTNGTTSISGGTVVATGGPGGAGIGGGYGGAAGTISISGGSVHLHSEDGAFDIGPGSMGEQDEGSCTFTGGAVFTTADMVNPPPCNAADVRVFPVTFATGVPNLPVTEFSGHVTDYGLEDVRTDDDGKVVFWLPPTSGTQTFSLTFQDGSKYAYCYEIADDGTVTASEYIFVNGDMVSDGQTASGTGWTCSKGVLTLSDASMAYTLQGNSTNGAFRIVVPNGARKLELAGLTLAAIKEKYASAIAISGPAQVSLSGKNFLSAAGNYAAGIEVASNATVVINGAGSLEANGGQHGAGIGSRGGNAPCGFVQIQSGAIAATGGDNAAGIGGGGNSNLQEGSILISGGVVEGHGGAYAAGIGAGRGNFRVPDGAVKITGGTVTACGDLTEAAEGSLGGSRSSSDFANSLGNTLSISGGGDYQATVITGGSVVPGNLGTVSPRPVDAAGTPLYRIFMGVFEPGRRVVFDRDTLPEGYSTVGLEADAGGRICLWLPATNRAYMFLLDGKYYATPSPFDADADFSGGSDVPPESIDPDEPGNPVLWRVTVPELDPGAGVVLDIEVETKVLVPTADDQGRFFFYVADGLYAFKANDADYAVSVSGRPATAVRVDPGHPTGVFVGGVDVCASLGNGWSYDSLSRQLVLSANDLVVSGSNTEGRVLIALADDISMTASNLTLAGASNFPAIAISPGASATLVLAGDNTLSGGYDRAAVEVSAGAAVAIRGDGRLTAAGGKWAAGIGGGNGQSWGRIAIAGGNVTAAGGDYGAGIGGGQKCPDEGGSVAISGGFVTATGGRFAAGIGGGLTSPGGAILLSGGTVHPQGGATKDGRASDVGDGVDAPSSGTNTFTGGTIFSTVDKVLPAAANAAGTAVWPVVIPGLEPNARISKLSVFGSGDILAHYGANDIFASAAGDLVLWLPDGFYTVDADGFDYAASVDGGPTTATPIDKKHPTGVFVDGTDVCHGIGMGWTYDYKASNLVLSAGGLVLSGTNAEGCVQVSLATNLSVTASNLTLSAAAGTAAILVPSGVSASLVLVGENTLCGGQDHAAVEVPAGAAIEIGGTGALSAAGGKNAAGIGYGGTNACGTITISGGTVEAEGGPFGAGIGNGNKGSGGIVSITDGSVTATGGKENAGIGGGLDSLLISGGTVAATGGRGSAGIGGGVALACTAIQISGGTVTATGGDGGAGVGSGQDGPEGAIAISGGFVTANGGESAAGIGGGCNSPGGSISILGGTVHPAGKPAQAGNASDIGGGSGSAGSGLNLFAGGTIITTADKVRPAAVNGNRAAVWPVGIPLLKPNAKIDNLTLRNDEGTLFAYGVNDLFASDDGFLFLWLPDGVYTMEMDGRNYSAIVAGGPTTAFLATDVRVNGIDAGIGAGEGWTYDEKTFQLVLSADGLVVSGTNTVGLVQIGVPADISVVASNLTLSAPGGCPAIFIPPGNSATLVLAGQNTLSGGSESPAIRVPGNAALDIGGDGVLAATGGAGGAGIGSGQTDSCGSITVSGGTVTAQGGWGGAGIGGGANTEGGAIRIDGGTVTAMGGDNAAGIGGGSVASGGAVTVNGGDVTAIGGEGGAGIGSGFMGWDGGRATIAGGKVLARGGDSAACIGGGKEGASADVAISGGTIAFSLGSSSVYAIGCGNCDGYFWPTSGSTLVTGGSVNLTNSLLVRCAAVNAAGAAVWPVAINGFHANEPIASLSLVDGNSAAIDYGTKDLFASETGQVVLWLPDGSYSLAVNGIPFTASVDGAPATAVVDPNFIATGVFVDGLDAGARQGDGWTYDPDSSELVLSGDGHVLSGKNVEGRVHVTVEGGISATASNLLLAASANAAAISISSAGGTATLVLAGQNTLYGGANHAAINVPADSSFTITGDGELSATGGTNGAGIGGGNEDSCGTVTISGGTVTAAGGEDGAGIGGGYRGSGGCVYIEGGTVKATGGMRGAGIGGGGQGDGGAMLSISNGTVTAKGGDYGAGIGGGIRGEGGCILVSGGTVTANGGLSGAGIGGGSHGSGGEIVLAGGTVTATGGSSGAGIGGGDSSPDSSGSEIIDGGFISIRGGMVTASGGTYAAGIGGGKQGPSGQIAIEAGTIHPTAGDNAYAVGNGADSPWTGPSRTFTGGAIFTTADMVFPSPANAAGDSVVPVVVTNLAPGAAVAFSGLPPYYGTADIYADDEGTVVLWLPVGDWDIEPAETTHVFFANGYEYSVSFVGGVNAGPGSVSTAAQGGALPLEGLEISGFSVDGGILTLHVVADPDTWTHGFADTLSLNQAETLSFSFAPVPPATPVLSPDGTVSFTLPLDSSIPAAFFCITAPR